MEDLVHLVTLAGGSKIILQEEDDISLSLVVKGMAMIGKKKKRM